MPERDTVKRCAPNVAAASHAKVVPQLPLDDASGHELERVGSRYVCKKCSMSVHVSGVVKWLGKSVCASVASSHVHADCLRRIGR